MRVVVHRSVCRWSTCRRRFREETSKVFSSDDLLDAASVDVPDLDEGWLDRDDVWVLEG